MKPQLLHWMSQDSARLLELTSQKNRKFFPIPARALAYIIRMLGYRLSWSDHLPEDVYAYTNFDAREVVIARDLRRRLVYPEAARGVIHASLAHELGHIRMHARQARQGKRGLHWEREAHAYACALLVPYRDVMAQPETQVLRAGLLQDQESLWKQVLRLAERYEVTGALMACALERYGIIKVHSKTRVIRACPILWQRARRVPRVA